MVSFEACNKNSRGILSKCEQECFQVEIIHLEKPQELTISEGGGEKEKMFVPKSSHPQLQGLDLGRIPRKLQASSAFSSFNGNLWHLAPCKIRAAK